MRTLSPMYSPAQVANLDHYPKAMNTLLSALVIAAVASAPVRLSKLRK